MKQTKEILDLSLICINQGSEYGKIKGLMIDPEGGNVEYLIIDSGQWYSGAELLPFSKVMGIGIDAVTTETEENIKHFNDVEDAHELAKKDIQIIGTKVYTSKGKFIGIVGEFFISEDDGKIIGCELENNAGIIPSQSIITFGKGVLVVVENVEENIQKQINDEINEKKNNAKPIVTDGQPQVNNKKTEDNKSNNDTEKPLGDSSNNLFEQRQRQFLIGRKSSKKIVADSGEILINDGQIITEEAIDKIKENGKLIELTMNTKA